MTSADEKSINKMLKCTDWRVITEYSEKGRIVPLSGCNKLIVPKTRMCPVCRVIFTTTDDHENGHNCKNGQCPKCKRWYCMNCLEYRTGSADWNCGIKCQFVGYQQIRDGRIRYVPKG